MRSSERPLALVTLEPLVPALQKALETMNRSFAVKVLCPERLDAGMDEMPADLSRRADSLIVTLPEGPVLLLFQGGDANGGVDLLVRILADAGREVHLVVEGSFDFEGRQRGLEVLRRAVSAARSVTLLDGRRVQARLGQDGSLLELLRLRSRLLSLLLCDLHAILSRPRDARVRKRLEGAWNWEGTWPDEAPDWSHLTRIVRHRDGERPAFAVLWDEDDPGSLARLQRRLEKLGLPIAWTCGKPSRAGVFFPEALGDWEGNERDA